jgi:hypothetical protein
MKTRKLYLFFSKREKEQGFAQFGQARKAEWDLMKKKKLEADHKTAAS